LSSLAGAKDGVWDNLREAHAYIQRMAGTACTEVLNGPNIPPKISLEPSGWATRLKELMDNAITGLGLSAHDTTGECFFLTFLAPRFLIPGFFLYGISLLFYFSLVLLFVLPKQACPHSTASHSTSTFVASLQVFWCVSLNFVPCSSVSLWVCRAVCKYHQFGCTETHLTPAL
jgi:hypothetical protein